MHPNAKVAPLVQFAESARILAASFWMVGTFFGTAMAAIRDQLVN